MNKLPFLISFLLSFTAGAQPLFVGNWLGKLNVGPGIRIVFHITQNGDKIFTATMDSPDQGVTGMQVNSTTIKGDSIFMDMATIKGKYTGKLTNAETISGVLQQGPASIPLDMKKTDNISTLNRPQTPKPPFNYKTEDITYTNADKSITYGATITIPNGNGPFPAVLLITGSGPQNRDEEIFEHKPFAVIADELTNDGYVVLRVDDRGVGKTTGDASNATTDDFVQDALVSFNYLLHRAEVNPKKAGVLGHSEGGLIAEIMAGTRKDVAFAILVAAPGAPIIDLMAEQNEQVLLQSGMSKEMVDKYLVLYKSICGATSIPGDKDEAKKRIAAAVKNWRANTDAATVAATTGITNDETEQKAINASETEFTRPWIRKFLSYNPESYIRNISCKVLAINGSRDIQVVATTNLNGIRAALKKSKSKSYEVKELQGLNHLLQTCHNCTVQEYKELEETIAPLALQTIKDWLNKEIK
jgi:uncharacterized protein